MIVHIALLSWQHLLLLRFLILIILVSMLWYVTEVLTYISLVTSEI